MRPTIIAPAFAAVLALAAATSTASAQDAGRGTVATSRASRVVATYDFGAKRRVITFPRTVVVEDSAGMLTARAALNRGRTEIPMQVTILESDLVLQGETPEGVLTVVLEGQNDGERGRLGTGHWSIGNTGGKLRVRTRQ